MQIDHLVMCLGGGVRDGGRLPDHVQARVETGVALVGVGTDAALLFSSSFTLNKAPVLINDSMICSEASAMAQYALEIGYRGRIYCEQQSHDTIGSAYFIFSDFVSFLQPKRMTLVTGDFHLERAKMIFCHISDLFLYQGDIECAEIPSEDFAERREKERKALQDYGANWRRIDNLADFRRMLFENHSNYNARFSSEQLAESYLESY